MSSFQHTFHFYPSVFVMKVFYFYFIIFSYSMLVTFSPHFLNSIYFLFVSFSLRDFSQRHRLVFALALSQPHMTPQSFTIWLLKTTMEFKMLYSFLPSLPTHISYPHIKLTLGKTYHHIFSLNIYLVN